ncbi:hypothetical protein BSK59_13480 [Paenibacillus odorifer]|uniref:hypothetical protein n=1 Tax=Paenibacillus odorifer TaxID=189426 RepID=UPI00096F4A72|nr:hypothetical protein [Paenibacillus odorifer]OME55482.1 hypothetical protein BSK59_13480 [Paenibacillus odorifer]
MNAVYEQEKACLEFRMIFNEEPSNHQVLNLRHMKLVTEYGKHTGNIEESLKLAATHLSIYEKARLDSFDEQEIINMILSVVRTT